MTNRTSILAFAASAVMLVVSFTLQSEDARASESDDAAIAGIEAITAAAWDGIDEAAAAAVSEIESAIKVGEATSAHNAGLSAVGSIYSSAVDELARVSEQALWSEPVVAAALEAAAALGGRAAQAVGDIDAALEAWLAVNRELMAAEVVADIEWWVQHGGARLDDIVEEYGVELGVADGSAAAVEMRDEAIADVERSVGQTTTKLDAELARLPDDPAVQAAHAQAVVDVQAAGDSAEATIGELFDAFVGIQPPSTTTTTSTVPPSTTTTVGPAVPTTTTTTTTTTPTTRPPVPITTTSTTTTTVAPAAATSIPPTTTTTTTMLLPQVAQLPPVDPPIFMFMAERPAPAVLSAMAESSADVADESSMASVMLVRRVVDSQLPAAVSVVAAGPLVVLGLIVDAIRAAGALMAVPWLLLGIYVVGLLRRQGPGLIS
jgi:hypothetical protein